jgi:hypothetical protein
VAGSIEEDFKTITIKFLKLCIFYVLGAYLLPSERDPVGVQVRAHLRGLRQGVGQVRRLLLQSQQTRG